MPCFGNGQPLGGGSGAALGAQIVLLDSTVFGIPKTIAIDWTATSNVMLEQLIMHWGGIPATGEDVILWNDAVLGPAFDIIFRNVNPNDEQITDLVTLAPFQWRVGDHVKLDFANTDNLAIGAQIILREVL